MTLALSVKRSSRVGRNDTRFWSTPSVAVKLRLELCCHVNPEKIPASSALTSFSSTEGVEGPSEASSPPRAFRPLIAHKAIPGFGLNTVIVDKS